MWGSVVIINLGCWLLISPFIFKILQNSTEQILHLLSVGTIFIFLGFLSCFYKTRIYSLLNILVGTWCVVFGYFFFDHPRAPIAQNFIIIGLLVIMFALVPPSDKTEVNDSIV